MIIWWNFIVFLKIINKNLELISINSAQRHFLFWKNRKLKTSLLIDYNINLFSFFLSFFNPHTRYMVLTINKIITVLIELSLIGLLASFFFSFLFSWNMFFIFYFWESSKEKLKLLPPLIIKKYVFFSYSRENILGLTKRNINLSFLVYLFALFFSFLFGHGNSLVDVLSVCYLKTIKLIYVIIK